MTETVCETTRLAKESTSVFVDASGRRRRRVKLAGYAMAAICGCYVIGVGSVVASNPRSPLASLPVASVLGDTFAAPTGAGGSLLNDLVDHVASGVSGALSGQEKAVVPGGIALSDRVLGAVRGVVENPLRDVFPKGLPGIVVAPHGGSVAGSGSGSGVATSGGGGGTAGGASQGTTASSQSPAPTGNGAPPVVSSPPQSSHPTRPQQLPAAGNPPPSATPSGTPSPGPSGTNQGTPPPTSQPSAPSPTSAPSSAPAPNPASDGPAPKG